MMRGRVVTTAVIDMCGHLACPVTQWPTVPDVAAWLRIPAAEVRGEIRAGRLGCAVLDGVTRVNPLSALLLLRDRPRPARTPDEIRAAQYAELFGGR
jgi:hypothetical protein